MNKAQYIAAWLLLTVAAMAQTTAFRGSTILINDMKSI